jgi:hypothetical protein
LKVFRYLPLPKGAIIPRYFFNIQAGIGLPGPIGTELPDIVAVLKEAMAAGCASIRRLGLSFWRSGQAR